jgi:sodium/hydrogen exchanger 2
MLLVLGLVLGIVMWAANLFPPAIPPADPRSELFFLVLLPLILFPGAYFLDAKTFLKRWEFGLILLHAFLGTALSALAIGFSIWAAGSIFSVPLGVFDALAFGSLLSATDPVAVLAVFEQIKVNAELHNLVSGEAVLNDAAGLTLYAFFVQLGESIGEQDFPPVDVAWAFLQFFIICCGGCAIGIVLGLLGALESRFTERSGVLEPLIVLSHGLVAYIIAFWIGMSAIIALFASALVMSFFVDKNAREGSRTGIRAMLYILGQLSETVVFLYVGASTFLILVSHTSSFDGVLIGITFALIIPLRFVIVFLFNTVTNIARSPSKRVPANDSFVQAYAGLRGPIAFALALALPESVAGKYQLVACTMVVVWSTIFILGSTTKLVVRWLRVRLATSDEEPIEIESSVVGSFFHKLFVRRLNWQEYLLGRHLRSGTIRSDEVKLQAINVRRVFSMADDKEGFYRWTVDDFWLTFHTDVTGIEEPSTERHVRPQTDLNPFSDLKRLRLHSDASLSELHFQSYDLDEVMRHPTTYNIFGWKSL